MEHVDVVIVGAGLSGVGAAHHLQAQLPELRFALLEAREAIGGTWDLFRYPGVRSDSDMQTLGYRFKPWTDERSLADGPAILEYVRETARESGIEQHVRFGHKVTHAAWADGRWTLTIEGHEPLSCSFLSVCGGYYRYDEGYSPAFPGAEDFTGELVHPQFWPRNLDYAGKRVVVIGSGATAVTLVPAMAGEAAHVTMLQRSPTYILSLPSKDKFGNALRRRLGDRRGYQVTRWKNVAVSTLVYQASQRFPKLVRRLIRKNTIAQLPAGFDVDLHFKPTYGPWDQRLCLVPDGDLFRALRHGQASIVTDTVERFTPTGVQLTSGEHLQADIIVTATGLNLLAFGGIQLSVDGAPVHLPDHLAYKGMMLSGVPNFVFTIGYTNASWTLKADLVAEFTCRLLAHLRRHGFTRVQPVDDGDVPRKPLLDFEAGYVQRALHAFPQAGAKAPWRLGMNYAQDVVTLRHGKLDDGALQFS